ncbi:MAG TPA: PPK2 family polyphosphate kinase [Verrucomicrobiae bacterium]|nr:PPK2 family polyphosphate kinase [Verrucomicrobiae bacterium]
MAQPIRITSKIQLRDFDPDYHEGLDKEKTRQKTDKLCLRISQLQQRLFANSTNAVLLVLQGMDTSGKDGATRAVLQHLNPAGVQVTYFKVPTAEERAHDFLWRIHKAEPRRGMIGVFNRSHYEDVLVVRVLELEPREVWTARYDQINAFEKSLTENNIILLKFFLHIGKEEQKKRLEARIRDPSKNWKLDLNDLKMRAHWDEFQEAYEDAINRCGPVWAPWNVVPANHKWFRNYVIARSVVRALEKLKLQWPKPKLALSRVKIK